MKIDNFINEGIHDPNIFKAIFTAGGPGSGKSFVIKKLLDGKGMKTVDLDSLFVYLLGKEKIGLDPASIASNKSQSLRKKAKELTKKRKNLFKDGRLGLIIDGTGRNPYLIEEQKDALEYYGYQCAMVFVNANINMAIFRNNLRTRRLKPDLVKQLHKEVSSVIGELKDMFGDNFFIIDNSSNNQQIERRKEFIEVSKKIEAFLRAPLSQKAQKWIQGEQ